MYQKSRVVPTFWVMKLQEYVLTLLMKRICYFALLREVYDNLGFLGNPERIYSMDETGACVPLDPPPLKVVAKKGQQSFAIVALAK